MCRRTPCGLTVAVGLGSQTEEFGPHLESSATSTLSVALPGRPEEFYGHTPPLAGSSWQRPAPPAAPEGCVSLLSLFPLPPLPAEHRHPGAGGGAGARGPGGGPRHLLHVTLHQRPLPTGVHAKLDER